MSERRANLEKDIVRADLAVVPGKADTVGRQSEDDVPPPHRGRWDKRAQVSLAASLSEKVPASILEAWGETMNYHAGIDVSLETANICIVDDAGTVIRELKVEASPEALIDAFKQFGRPLKRVGLEAGIQRAGSISKHSWLRQRTDSVGSRCQRVRVTTMTTEMEGVGREPADFRSLL